MRISTCHCLARQRRTGSVSGAEPRFAQDAVTIEGNARESVRVADSGNRVTSRFCPDCGATVYYTLDAVPGFTAIRPEARTAFSLLGVARCGSGNRRYQCVRRSGCLVGGPGA